MDPEFLQVESDQVSKIVLALNKGLMLPYTKKDPPAGAEGP
jgi:hypothetical protein